MEGRRCPLGLARAAIVAALGLGLAACDVRLPDLSGATPAPAASDDATADAVAPAGGDEAAGDSGSEAGSDVGTESGTEAGAQAPTADLKGDSALEAASGDAPAAPGDMLSATEAETAVRMALGAAFVDDVVAFAVDRDAVLAGQSGDAALDAQSEEARVRALADRPSYRVIYSERYGGKGEEARAAQVGIYRYDTAQAVFAKVDLASGDVEPLALPEGVPPPPVPLVPDETREAALVARADPAVRDRLSAAGLSPDDAAANGLLTLTDDPTSPCATGRCVRLFFSSLDRPVPEFSVVVDLVTFAVVEIGDMPGRSLNP